MLKTCAAIITLACALPAHAQMRPDDVPPRPVEMTAAEPVRGAFGDFCTAAISITDVPFSTQFNNAALSADGPPGSCNNASAVVMQNDIWYVWTPDADYQAQLSITEVDSYDTIAAVYTGSCGALTEIACGDEPEPFTLNFNANAGTTYYIQCGDWGSAPGGGLTQLNLDVSVSNNSCETATQLPDIPSPFTFDNRPAAPNGSRGTCNSTAASTMQNAVWFKWTAQGDFDVTVNVTELTSYDMIVQVWEGFDNCAGLTTEVCGDEPEPIQMQFQAQRGRTYYFQCGDWGTAPGGGLTQLDIQLEVTNDACADAVDLTNQLNWIFDNRPAQPGLPNLPCNTFSAADVDNDAWFRWTAPYDVDVILTVEDIAPGSYDFVGGLYAGSCASLSLIECLDPQPAVIPLTMSSGTTYFLQMGDWGVVPGGGVTEITLDYVYDNEACADAIPLTGTFNFVSCGNFDADPGFPIGSCNRMDFNPATIMQNDLWWEWTAPADGIGRFQVFDNNTWDPILAVYTGSCEVPTEVGCDSPLSGETDTLVEIPVTANQTYLIQVGDWGAFEGGGAGNLAVQFRFPCPGDATGDNLVNFDDLNLLLEYWGETVTPGTNGDVTADGKVNFDDLNFVLEFWGQSC